MAFCYTDGGGALATPVGAVTGLALSANNVGFGTQVTLTWTAAQGGAGNGVAGYRVYKNGEEAAQTQETQCAVTSPLENASDAYTVRALGKIGGFDGPVSEAAVLTSIVTAPGVPGNVRLSKTDVKLGATATLTWSAAAAGINNAVAGYHVYRNGTYLASASGTSLAVTASGVNGGKYTYTVYAIGSVAGYNSAQSAGVTLTAHAPTAIYVQYYTQSATFTVPSGTERIDVTCIGGGGGGGRGGYNYNYADARCPGGGGGGGTGQIAHTTLTGISAGASYAVTVGGGGSAGAAGGASGFGSILSAAGGSAGGNGWESPGTLEGTANGGAGGAGGIGGAGGGAGRGGYSHTLGGDGGTGASSQAWQSWAGSEWYVFRDTSAGRRLGISGAGGSGYSGGRNAGQGKTAEQLPGTLYGSGGNGGDNNKNGTQGAGAGGAGLVAVRCMQYV